MISPAPSKLTVSQCGLDLIKQFEAFRPQVYLCPAGKRTIGYGHVMLKSDILHPPISMVQAEDLLRQDCCIPENYINACASFNPRPSGRCLWRTGFNPRPPRGAGATVRLQHHESKGF